MYVSHAVLQKNFSSHNTATARVFRKYKTEGETVVTRYLPDYLKVMRRHVDDAAHTSLAKISHQPRNKTN